MSEYLDELVKWEGLVTWMYKDTRGFPTTGIGHLLHDLAAALELPWFVGEAPARESDVREDFRRLAAVTIGAPAIAYEAICACRLTVEFVKELADRRLEHEFLPGLAVLFPGFHGLPFTVRAALVDMAWNLGLNGISKFHRLQKAVDACDWPAAAVESHVVSSRGERNEWRAGCFLAAGATTVT